MILISELSINATSFALINAEMNISIKKEKIIHYIMKNILDE